MQRCYCGHSSCGSGSSSILKLPRPRSDLQSLTSSSRLSVQPHPQTQFIKRPHARSSNLVELGFGHSNSGLSRDFSRRNSASTTVSDHCSSCCSSCGQQLQQQQRDSRVKALSWGSGQMRHNSYSNNSKNNHNNNSHCEYTDNRRFYEQRASAVGHLPKACQGQFQTQTQVQQQQTSLPTHEPRQDCNAGLQRLMTLQQFRLLNSSDCFSTQRQDELRLQQAYNKLSATDTDKWQKNRANESKQQSTTASTPYALRQKLLQVQLQQDEAKGRGSGAICAPIEPSCALRYNCQWVREA